MLKKLLNFLYKREPLTIQVKKLNENAIIPSYAHSGDVGMDFTAISVEYNIDMDCYIYHTGLAFASEFNYGQFLFPRSSNRKKECYLCNSVGVADSAIYRGEIMFCYKNRTSIKDEYFNKCLATIVSSSKSFKDFQAKYSALNNDFSENWNEIKSANTTEIMELAMKNAPYDVGDRIGQFIMIKCPETKVKVVEELNDTERGNGGFGSTGN